MKQKAPKEFFFFKVRLKCSMICCAGVSFAIAPAVIVESVYVREMYSDLLLQMHEAEALTAGGHASWTALGISH